jgi:hypothetical protein
MAIFPFFFVGKGNIAVLSDFDPVLVVKNAVIPERNDSRDY